MKCANTACRGFSLTLLAALAASGSTALADPVPVLTVTEQSDTVLQYSWSTGQSGTIENLGPDYWNGPFVWSDFATPMNVGAIWYEPDDAGFGNVFEIYQDIDDLWKIIVFSDEDLSGEIPPFSFFADGQAVQVENGQSRNFDMIFVDVSDAGAVPEASTWLGAVPMIGAFAFAAVRRARSRA